MRSTNGHRRFTIADLERLLFIKRAQSLGFSLKEISSLLVSHKGRPNSGCKRKTIAAKLNDLRTHRKTLDKQIDVLKTVLLRCRNRRRHQECTLVKEFLATLPL